MKDLLWEFENRLDCTNLLDVSYALCSLHVKLQACSENGDTREQEEYALCSFHVTDLLGMLKRHPEDKQDIFATAHTILLSCIEIKKGK